MKIYMAMLLLLLSIQPQDAFDLKADLKKDYAELHKGEHGVHFDGTEKQWRQFRTYASLNMAAFIFSKKISNEHTVLKWVKRGLTIVEIKSILPGDTIYRESGKVIKIKPHNFIYHSYIIYPENKKRLLYISEKSEGLLLYRIGDQEYFPLREAILLNLRTPDVNEILELAKSKAAFTRHHPAPAIHRIKQFSKTI